MQGKRTKSMLMALITTVGMMLAVSAPAQAGSPSSERSGSNFGISAADGYFYAWTGTYRTGTTCRWFGDSDHWGSCRNTASSAENRGYAGPYDDVNVYWGTSATGAWTCMANGGYWLDLTLCIEWFNNGSPGWGECVNNNASSHRWVNSC
jgi:hypothetical protein